MLKKRAAYSPSKMKVALDMVRSGTMSKRKAAATYNIPRTTLLDKLAGRSPEDKSRPGPSTVLTVDEERVLADYCQLMASIGYPLGRRELLLEVKKILDIDGRKTPFRDNMPGKDWFYAFKRRHPDLTERTAMALGHQRAAINISMVQSWYDTLFAFLKDEVDGWEEMIADPRRVFNADESGFPLCVKSGKVLAPSGAKHVYHVTTGSKTQITVLVCFNAIGNYVPPMILYPGERFRDIGMEGFPEALYGHTSNGWMDTEAFISYLHHFAKYISEKKIPTPVLFFIDGHSTHISLKASEFCARSGIVLYCLLPNATHILQACDVGFFSPMKSAWKKQVKQWQMKHLGECLTKKAFPGIFKEAYDTVATIGNAAHGFQRSGLFPLEVKGIDISKLEPSKVANPPTDRVGSSQSDNTDSSVTKPPADGQGPRQLGATDTPVTNSPPTDQQGPSQLGATNTLVTNPPSADRQGPSQLGATDTPEPCTSADKEPEKENTMKPTSSGTPRPFTTPLMERRPCQPGMVSEAFQHLTIPEPKKRKVSSNRLSAKLPKALTGNVALQIFKEREEMKIAEAIEKQKRKEDRELKKKQKDELKEKKRKEREELKRKRQLEKELKKQEQKKKRKQDVSDSSSSSEDEKVVVRYMDTDDSYDERSICPGCKTDDGDLEEWVTCSSCPRQWHVSCTGDDTLLQIPVSLIPNYPFYCEYCLNSSI